MPKHEKKPNNNNNNNIWLNNLGSEHSLVMKFGEFV